MDQNAKDFVHQVLFKEPARLGWLARGPRSSIQGFSTTPEVLIAWAECYPDWDFYVCPNPTTSTGKPRVDEITSLRYMVLDFDPLPDTTLQLEDLDDTLQWLSVGVGVPRSVVTTGRGAHVYFSIAPDCVDPLRGHRALRGWTRHLASQFSGVVPGLRLDQSCGDISHVFRLPGTRNSRNGIQAACYTSNALGATVIQASDLNVWDVPEPAPRVRPPAALPTLFHILPLLPPSARRFLQEGTSTRFESRHTRCFAAAASLAELGVPESVGRDMIAAAAQRCIPPLTDWERPFRNGFLAGRVAGGE